MGVIFAIFGGQIAIMMTDFLQGIFCNIAFLILMIYLVRFFDWSKIFESLIDHASTHPGESMFNPFQTTRIKDFNIWYFLMGIVLTVLSNGTWQGSSGYVAAARNAHESKMSRFLGTWRGLVQAALLLFIPICAFTFFHHPDFAQQASVVEGALQQLSGQDPVQARVPLFLAYALPTGLVGVFAAVMFAAMLSTDDTYMHSWGSILVQDVIMPFRKSKEPLDAKQHLRMLRLSIIFVGIFAFFFSWLFKQTEYIALFFQITGAIFTGGAGAVLIGGLYSKTGSTLGAWVAMIFGSATALGSIALQQTWTRLAPWLAGFCSESNAQWLLAHADRFPINSQILTFVITLLGFAIYFLFSWIDRKMHKLPEFNLNKMLHRGEYDTMGEHKENWSAGRIWRILGLTNEFTTFDRILFFASISWSLIWFICFFIGLVSHFAGLWEPIHWLRLWKFYVMLGFCLGIGTTIWFLICGFIDIKKLFSTLATMERNEADNGTVVDGQNAGEDVALAPAEKAPETK
jgi:SSS family solute:Na+ symporter